MSAHPVVQADALARILPYLRSDPELEGLLGGPGRIAGINKPPYPRLSLSYLVGDDRETTWLISPNIQFEALGDPDGTPGSGALRRILYTALSLVQRLPDLPVAPTDPVITRVLPTTSAAPLPLPSGQPRWVASRRIYVHPPFPS